ncbi:acetone carboxylase [Nocardioides sp. zg-536]|uniref:Acetone carboxylase n=1 Tax=Nocardioides faecalis TaxID=2803858 RepID=A0A938Y4A3_9ACTN|nr:acetone carboxylase [Nocardioides faecalis]MBM9458990.1 acetone carboxylase [Nocardioides faecalis]
MSSEVPQDQDAPDHCSARGCRTAARFQLRWNNPKLHPPERRKTWLACAEHRESLEAFLGARGFLRETVEHTQPVSAQDAVEGSAADR